MKIVSTAAEAVSIIESNQRVFIHTAAAAPQQLIQAMTDRHADLKNVEIVSAHTEGPVPYAAEEFADSFTINCFFVGHNIRSAVQNGRANYIPIFLSEIPKLFTSGRMPLDIALVTVSKPNKKGFCSLGCSVDISNAAVDNARIVIAQINPNMPFVHGNGIISVDKIDMAIEVNDPLYEMHPHTSTETEIDIGQNVASLVEDGATLQMGIGGIPDAALKFLMGHKDLGIHTEMCSDGLVDLVNAGVVNGMKKTSHFGKIVAGFAYGTRKIYDFIDENPIVNMMDVGYVNDTRVIRQNHKMTAINSAIEIDVFGQVCADSIGTKHYSGIGGQMDFIRGATLSEGGKAIIALPSRTSKGIPRIVSMLKQGAPVVTTRAHVQYIVTEHGIANLYGVNLKERAKLMVNIAHPDDREDIAKTVFENFKMVI
ncbi:MAG: acetyl-CoA hydrolase/transferase C-terminal domain-containing protein [Putridiphycobacter sp.]|nr:acetyl-CoA hydrolase/transferase C-terminal domain-containing protein [Putridiphycobacter sp.]